MAGPGARRGMVWAFAGVFGVILASGLLVAPPPAEAAFPGLNGKIAFRTNRDSNDEVYAMNADGSGQTNRSGNPGSSDGSPPGPPTGPGSRSRRAETATPRST